MKLSTFFLRAASLAACLSATGVSLAVEIQCPAHITMEPVAVRDVPEGWRAAHPVNTLPVWGVSVTVGPPEDLGVLKPTMLTLKGRKSLNWTFTPTENEKGIWLSCVYGNAPVQLARKLPNDMSTCVSYQKDLRKDGGKVVTLCH